MTAQHTTQIHDVAVRPARPDDAETILRFIVALAEFERLTPPDAAAQARLIADAFGPRRRFDIFLADIGGVPVGYAFVLETYSTFLARPTLYIEDIFVLPEYRGRKAGYALLMHCVTEALRRDCGRCEWMALNWNERAIRFYESLGAKHLDEWRTYRLDRSTMERLTET